MAAIHNLRFWFLEVFYWFVSKGETKTTRRNAKKKNSEILNE